MTFWKLILRSLRFHARTHLGVLLGAIIGSAALIGALIVGDSVKGSLRDRALARLGTVAYGMSTGARFFLRTLNERTEAGEVHSIVPSGNQWVKLGSFGSGRAALMQLPGTASRADGTARA